MTNKRAIILALCLFLLMIRHAEAKTTYTVQNGDTLWKIAHKYSLSLNSLINSNPQVQDPDLIYPGQDLNIPGIKELKKGKTMGEKESRLLELTNNKRQQSGMKPLVLDPVLSKAANQKAYDMRKREYVSHNSPTYGNPTIMLKAQAIPFLTVKENIGAGYRSADEMFSAWMNSSIHRGNILDEQATHIGIGYAEGGLHGQYWTILIVKRN